MHEMNRHHVMRLQREFSIMAAIADDLLRIPFTRRGVGADAAAGAMPVIGDAIGLVMAMYVILRAGHAGMPIRQLLPALALAAVDVLLGLIPGAGDVADVLIRPSRRAVRSVNAYLSSRYGIAETVHMDRPIMHRFLEQRRTVSPFWRAPIVSWATLHLADLVGVALVVSVLIVLWTLLRGLAGLTGASS